MEDLNKDEQRAQKLLALAMDLMSSPAPIPTARLMERHFTGLSHEAARKQLARAREALATCGLIIEQTRTRKGTLWSVDPACYPLEGLDQNDASVVQLLTVPLLRDESFPHRGNLRFALMKLGNSPTLTSEKPPILDDHTLEAVRACLDTHHILKLDYEDAAGKLTHRRVAPLGLFEFRAFTYLVCNVSPAMDPDGIRTLRCDRMSHASKTSATYQVPADFDVNEYRLLPFQMGPSIARCTFALPESTQALLVETTLGKGELYTSGNQRLWDVEASSFDDAAAWAIAHGLTPMAPDELVERWHERLRGCLA